MCWSRNVFGGLVKHERHIITAKSEGIAEDAFHPLFAIFAHGFQADFRIDLFKSRGAGYGLFLERLHCQYRFDCATGGERVAKKSFYRTEWYRAISKECLQRL